MVLVDAIMGSVETVRNVGMGCICFAHGADMNLGRHRMD